MGLKFVPDFGAQIGQQYIFIIWQDGQMPHQSFFTNVSPNGPTGNQLISGSQIEKNTLSIPGQIGNIVVKNFQHVFQQSGQIRVIYCLNDLSFKVSCTSCHVSSVLCLVSCTTCHVSCTSYHESWVL